LEKNVLTRKRQKKKKVIIWPCSFQQENLVKFEEKLQVCHTPKNNLIFVSCENKFLAQREKKISPHLKVNWSVPNFPDVNCKLLKNQFSSYLVSTCFLNACTHYFFLSIFVTHLHHIFIPVKFFFQKSFFSLKISRRDFLWII